jgi:hypothetical protein
MVGCGSMNDRGSDLTGEVFIRKTPPKTIPFSEMRYMEDGTISWDQPPSDGVEGWNGRCGETAAANLIAMYYQGYASAPLAIPEYIKFEDPTPGTRVETLTLGMNNFQKKIKQSPRKFLWKSANASSSAPILDLSEIVVVRAGSSNRAPSFKNVDKTTHKKFPVAALLQMGKQFHWVTIVNVVYRDGGYHVVYNDHGKQTTISSSEFLKMWTYGADPSPMNNVVGKLLKYSPLTGNRVYVYGT